MSQIIESSPKHCAKKGLKLEKRHKKFFLKFSVFFTAVLFLVLLLWLILHPAKPRFSLTQTDIYQLRLSGPHSLNSSIQLTLFSNNPNRKVGIYYDKIQIYAAYKGQRITSDTSMPPFYQEHDEANTLSALLQGTALPVSSSFIYEVGRDQMTGKLAMYLKMNGKLRWKIGTWVSGQYRFNVNCITVLAVGPSASSGPLTSRQGALCSTTI